MVEEGRAPRTMPHGVTGVQVKRAGLHRIPLCGTKGGSATSHGLSIAILVHVGVYKCCIWMFPKNVVLFSYDLIKWGRIIIISSIAGLGGFAYGGAYCASKHAVLGMMKCAAEEVLKTGVTVNAICPGYVATPIIDRSVENIMGKAKISKEDALASLRDTNPFGRLIEPDEVAAAALWLCGPGSGAVTAQAIPISGGQV